MQYKVGQDVRLWVNKVGPVSCRAMRPCCTRHQRARTCVRPRLKLPAKQTPACLLPAAVQYNNPQETYNYYYLPFCKPVGAGKAAHKWGGLGEVLEGNQLIDSQLDMKYRCASAGGPKPSSLPCLQQRSVVHGKGLRIHAAVLVLCSACAKEDHLHTAAWAVGGHCICQCRAQALLVWQHCVCHLQLSKQQASLACS